MGYKAAKDGKNIHDILKHGDTFLNHVCTKKTFIKNLKKVDDKME